MANSGHSLVPRFDGLIVRSDGWTDALAESGLNAIHVTASDWVGDYASTRASVVEWGRILERQSDHFYLIRTAEDLAKVGEDPRVGVVLGLQNGEPIEDDIGRLADLWDLGLRVFQLTYNEANLLADGCTEAGDGGLTELGREAVAECNRLGMLVDLSHVGHRSCLDAVEASSVPVAVTHANRRAVVDNPRNKPDDVLLAVAQSGGVIGVTPWSPMCWRGGGHPGFEDFIAQLSAVLELVGIDSVVIGSDLAVVTAAAPPSAAILERSAASHPEIFAAYVAAVDNTIETRYCRGFQSVARWAQLPDDLAALGLSDEERAKVLGGNWLRLFAGVLPSAGPEEAR